MGKNTITIYEGAMCCSSGVCGPEPDKNLINFNESLKKLENVEIIRGSLTYNINMFLENADIFQMVKDHGLEILPIITYNGKVVSKQKYLKYEELKKIMDGENNN